MAKVNVFAHEKRLFARFQVSRYVSRSAATSQQEITCFVGGRFDACRRARGVGVRCIAVRLENDFIFGDGTKFVEENLRFVRLPDDPRCVRVNGPVLDHVAVDRSETIGPRPRETNQVLVCGQYAQIVRTLGEISSEKQNEGEVNENKIDHWQMCQLFILIENDRALTAVRRSNKQASKQTGRHNSQTGQLFDSVKEREKSLVGLFFLSLSSSRRRLRRRLLSLRF